MILSDRVKIVVFVPATHADLIRAKLLRIGAGVIGRYSGCSFSSQGVGRFIPSDDAHPFLGDTGVLNEVIEEKIETSCLVVDAHAVLAEIKKIHPYEEPLIELLPLYSLA